MPPVERDPVGGTLTITDGVISDLIGYAALETFGVVGMAAPSLPDGIAKILPTRALWRGVTFAKTDAGLNVDMYVVVEYGVNLTTVAKNLVDRVRFVVENYTDLTIADISIHIQGVHIPKAHA
jgi:uncharacterized alkaline shock family protein YloU